MVSTSKESWRSDYHQQENHCRYIDDSGQFKDWYFAAEDKSFSNRAIAYLKDPSLPRPEPPANTTHDQNHRSTCNRSKPDRFGSNNMGTGRPEQSRPQPRRRQQQQPPRQEDQGIGYDISAVGEDEEASLAFFDLKLNADWIEIKKKYKINALIYHPDKHKPDITQKTNKEAGMRLTNSAYRFLKDVYNGRSLHTRR